MDEKLITSKVFILTGEWQDIRGRNILRFIGKSNELGPVEIIINNSKPVFFIERKIPELNLSVNYKRKSVKLSSFSREKVDAVYFNSQRNLLTAAAEFSAQGIPTFESDIDPVRRYLMERFINAQIQIIGLPIKQDKLLSFINPKIEPCEITPELTVASLDIETGSKNEMLYSIGVHVTGKLEEKHVFMLGETPRKQLKEISFFPDEESLIKNFLEWFKEIDPDVIIGWHVIGFDLMFIERKCTELFIPFDISRSNGRVTLKSRKGGGYFASVPGRIVIDGPPALRASFFTFEDFKLETVAKELLGMGKSITPDQNKIQEIERLFVEDKVKLAEYNLNDAMLVTDIFRRAGLIELYIRRAQLSGLLMDQLGMMTAAFDHFFLPKLHRAGFVAPNIRDLQELEHAAGGYVLDPKPGIYDDVIVMDFKSLYPSIIQTFKIDPLSRLMSNIDQVVTPKGYRFSSSKNFLPDFITWLGEQRSAAKKKGDKQLAQAIKILMNSFYGVMGSYGCRFYHPDLPSAITSTGQWLLIGSKDYLEAEGYETVYGDTDSLFVRLKEGEGRNAEQIGKKLVEELNAYWHKKLKKDYKVESHLEIEFEKHYKKFIITPARGAEVGAKKRYAGLLVENGTEKIEFVGMEFVRSDWTRLAKEFQVELYDRIFKNMEIEDWIRSVEKKVNKGEYDNKLIYRKRLRKDVDQYTKNIPQHVKAAKLLNKAEGVIYYVITERGPIPIELKHNDIDYEHYIEKQIKPIADSVLTLLGKSFDSIAKPGQLSFF